MVLTSLDGGAVAHALRLALWRTGKLLILMSPDGRRELLTIYSRLGLVRIRTRVRISNNVQAKWRKSGSPFSRTTKKSFEEEESATHSPPQQVGTIIWSNRERLNRCDSCSVAAISRFNFVGTTILFLGNYTQWGCFGAVKDSSTQLSHMIHWFYT